MENFLGQYTEVFMNLAIAMILGMVIGIERLFAKKIASMRTYAFVSMGAALFVTIAINGSEVLLGKFPAVNPVYIMAQIISGVGFLGAGIIIFKNSHLTGITSASGLWVSSGIGMACGFGFYGLATIATLLTIFIFTIMWVIEQRLRRFFPENDPHDDDQK